ncbi:hydrogen peroxide-inducible genes activator [Corynebacterium sp. HMSC29G08]|uniref:hydrogen peroxide-inducible genes activator n=1 Tax=Corynebacterium sp. HMSC29G08 TaxID=1581069 RepID=UPI0008A3E8D6|nr:hydrogen peroxide-inducible genes activator [Corynebacterium sp. HMSC29G08]OFT86084.1 LysR family transcriptional regulator [Corynebacterium sp. HMSC29G08]
MPNREFRPTLSQLRSFVTVAEQKHFGSAAAKLGISQPSLSQGLAALEEGLGVQLIERSTRKVIVTATGEALLPDAKAAIHAAEALVVRARGAADPFAGPLTLGIIPTIAPYLLPHLLPLIADEFPQTELQVVEEKTERLLAKLRDGLIDVALIALPTDTPGLEALPLYSEPFAAVMPKDHPLAGKRDLALDDLGQLELLLLDDGHCLRDQVIDLCKTAGVANTAHAHAVARASSLTTVVQMVVAGMGATLLPASALAAECHRPNLSVAQFAQDSGADREVGVVFRTASIRKDHFAELGSIIKRAYESAVDSWPEYE